MNPASQLQLHKKMPRKKVPASSEFAYHISARCINREWFKLPIDEVWKIFENRLYIAKYMYDLRIHSFVLMSNHFHLIVSTPKANISAAMTYFIGEVGREIAERVGRINQTFGTRHNKTLLVSYNYFLNSYKYVFQNPMRAKICNRVEDYKYSTLHGCLGLSNLVIPIEEDTILFPLLDMDQSALEWLNTPVEEADNQSMRLALQKGLFSLPRANDRANRLGNERL